MRYFVRNKRGAALVEFAIVASLFFALVFGAIEFSLLMKDYLTLNQAVREGVRSAAIGSTDVESTVLGSSPTLDTARISNIVVSYRIRDLDGWPSEWTSGYPPTGTGTEDIQCRVSAQYAHNMVTGTMFRSSPITVSAEMVMRLE